MAHVLIVEARFYDHLNDLLLSGARAAIEEAGHSHETITVPGALEIPGAVAMAARGGNGRGRLAATARNTPASGCGSCSGWHAP